MQLGATPAFFINLDRDASRRELMEAELARAGIAAESLSAVEGRAVPACLRPYYAEMLSDGEVGCSASHLLICKSIIERGLRFALVFEDDARFAANSVEAIRSAINSAPAGWDIIRLVESSSQPFQVVASLGTGRFLVRYLRIPRSTTGLIVSASGAVKLLAPRTIREPIDVEIRWPWQLDLNVYGIEAPIVTQASGRDLETTIPVRSRIRKLNQLRRLAFNVRKMGVLGYACCRLERSGTSIF